MVEGLVRTLADHRFVVDARDDRAHSLSERELTEYASEISFIRYGYDSPEWRFQQVRDARILLYGQGPVLAAVAQDGLRSGWRRLRILPRAGETILRAAAERARRDEGQQIIVETAGPDPAGDPLLRDGIADADLVVHVASGDDTEALLATARRCADAGVALTQVLVRDADVWATPVYERDHRLVESGWRWLVAGQAERRETGVSWLTGPVPSLIAATVVLACFRHLARMRPERTGTRSGSRIDGTMTRTDLESLTTTAHRFHPHPAGGAAVGMAVGMAVGAAATQDTIASLRAAERVSQGDLLARARGFVDPYLGPLRSLDEEDLPQVPLALCRATVIDPYGRRPPSAVEPVVAWGSDRETARVRAVLAALAAYGSLVAEHEAQQAGDRATAWGMDLLTGAVRRVRIPGGDPATKRRAYAAPLGAAAGLCWDEAVGAGLLAHFEALPVLGEEAGAPSVDPVRESGDGEGVLDTVRLLERTGEVFEFRDHSAAVGLPAYTVTAAGGAVTRSVASAPDQALRHAAEHALLSWQARVEGRPEVVPSSRRWAAGGPPDPAFLALRLLRVTGRTPVVVPLVRDDHRGAAGSLLPFVVQVVLCDD
ncbi:hypothetical protein ACIBQX_44010 [Nonomuraea sp. NPDC049714]|uniref:hypothetical protein n=1 Tax=Nonomuraea sp. NPDC049714 TaxID=3364357 RepID=UPI0037BCA3A1